MKRTIPSVMFSQHPDHARTPFWHEEPLIEARDELEECFLMMSKLGAEEMMWDWEGKLVDEAVMERLLGEHLDFFRKHPLGKRKFLTFRIPNPRVESGYRLGRAFMVILSAKEVAQQAGFRQAPLFEIILPMTEYADELMRLHESFDRFAEAASSSFGANGSLRHLEVIPLFETVETIRTSNKLLQDYVRRYHRRYGREPRYLRPFVARSDPALNSGIVATTLAIKWALSEYAKWSKHTGIETFPIIAPGALPFRGGLTPDNAGEFLDEFKGVRTVVIQSAFRYDYPLLKVKQAVRAIIRAAPKGNTELLSASTGKIIGTLIPWFEKPYRDTVLKAAKHIQRVAAYIPPRRERMQHTGLFGYSRGVGSARLPRAIGFTASCYSLGIPPEFFGIGRGLMRAKKEGKLETVEALYKTLRASLERAGRYLRKESLSELRLPKLAEDIEYVEAYLGKPLGPKTAAEKEHVKLSGRIVALLKQGKKEKALMPLIERAALLRRSLG